LRFPSDIESASGGDGDVAASVYAHPEVEMKTSLGRPGEGASFPGTTRGHLADHEVFVRANDSGIAGVSQDVAGFV
jgi:hypothetical protein